MNKTNDALSKRRNFCRRLATHDLATVKECHAAILRLIEQATSEEQLHEIGNAIIHSVLVSNPKLFRQLDNGNWVLRNSNIVAFPPTPVAE